MYIKYMVIGTVAWFLVGGIARGIIQGNISVLRRKSNEYEMIQWLKYFRPYALWLGPFALITTIVMSFRHEAISLNRFRLWRSRK